MGNAIPSVPNYELHYLFDIKGSSINREVLKDKLLNNTVLPTYGKVLKDLDYYRIKEIKEFMRVEISKIHSILRTLKIDVEYLKSQRFMDYSLLLAIRKKNSDQQANFFETDEKNIEERLEDKNNVLETINIDTDNFFETQFKKYQTSIKDDSEPKKRQMTNITSFYS